MALPAH